MRVIINELVCEGCGDCGIQSNCVSVQPVETEFGRKRKIDQSSCNKDFSCVEGFCPSFVTVHGARLKKAEAAALDGDDPLAGVPEPVTPSYDNGWASIVTGVGGTGVVTIGAILGMAAHLEGKGCGMIDMAGLAQKGGAVHSHVRISATPEDVTAIRVPAGKADLILGCDLVVSGSRKVLAAVREGETLFVANTAEVMPGDFTRNADFSLPVERLKRAILTTAGVENTAYFDATGAATALFGNAIAANMFMLGLAYQRGGLSLTAEALEQAIRLNGQAVELNLSAFRWGRRAAHDPQAVLDRMEAAQKKTPVQTLSESLDEVIERRRHFLVEYQNAAYAERFVRRIASTRAAEENARGEAGRVTESAARNLFKLMAIKDEYAVARLYSDGSFAAQMAAQFESWERLEFHMAPPLLAETDEDGRMKKRNFGHWMMKALPMLASLRSLRGTAFDLFGYQRDRRVGRRLLRDYESLLDIVAAKLDTANGDAAARLLAYPERIRGFGHVKLQSMGEVEKELPRLRAEFDRSDDVTREAAE